MIQYVKPIDGLRALAVLSVLVGHWTPVSWFEDSEFGRIGVIMFFLISGYLITGILLNLRSRISAGEISRVDGLRRFYIRRSLRIFPLYYFVVLIAIVGIRHVREAAIPHLFFFQNFSALAHPPGHYHMAIHLWSLAVEEQFYVVWSILLLTMRQPLIRFLPWMLLAIAFTFKVWCALTGEDTWVLRVSTFGNIDSLAVGALVYMAHANNCARTLRVLRQVSILFGPILFYFVQSTRTMGDGQAIGSGVVYMVFFDSTVYCLLWLLLDNAKNDFWKPVNQILCSRVVVYLGKISYGIYVYHLFVGVGLSLILTYILGKEVPSNGALHIFAYNLAATVLISHISWIIFERKMIGMKDKLAPT